MKQLYHWIFKNFYINSYSLFISRYSFVVGDASDDPIDDAGVSDHRDDVDDDSWHWTKKRILQKEHWNL